MIGRIVEVLEGDPVIASVAEGGLYDRDIRGTGFAATPVAFDTYGDPLPTLCIVPGPELPRVYDHQASYSRAIYALGIAPRTPAGRAAVATMLDRVVAIMHRWQDPVTGAVLQSGGRTGLLEDEDGVTDRLTLNAIGVHPVERW